MLIYGALFIMVILTLFSMIFSVDGVSSILGGTFGGTTMVNASETDLTVVMEEMAFGIDPTMGLILAIAVLGGIVALLGIQAVGSGLSETSVRILTLTIVYGGLWTVLSILSRPLIIEIQIFGTLLYIILTVVYVIGVFDKAFRGGGG